MWYQAACGVVWLMWFVRWKYELILHGDMWIVNAKMWIANAEMWIDIGDMWIVIGDMWIVIGDMWIVIGDMWIVIGDMWIVNAELWNANAKMWFICYIYSDTQLPHISKYTLHYGHTVSLCVEIASVSFCSFICDWIW